MVKTGDLQAQVRLLQAMQLEGGDSYELSPPKLNLTLCMDEATIATLQDLPAWRWYLDFRECEWPLEPAAYVRLGQAIPPSYGEWGFVRWEKPVPYEAVLAMCRGANKRREGLAPLMVKACRDSPLEWREVEWVGAHVVIGLDIDIASPAVERGYPGYPCRLDPDDKVIAPVQ